MSERTVPLVDIGPFLVQDSGARAAVAAEVREACEETGFLTVVGHGVPAELVGRMGDISRAFFDLPVTEKLRLTGEPVAAGLPVYRPTAAESLAASLGSAAPGDLKESLDWGPTLAGVAWPERPEELRRTWLEYYGAMLGLGGAIMRVFAAALELPLDFFADKFDERSSSIRVINYPEPEEEPLPGQLRAGAHRDYGVLTILRSEAAAGGLEVQARDGEWIGVEPPDEGFVVNIGELMARWTNDAWAATLHRVVNPPRERRIGSRRQSLVFFHNPRSDAVIETIDRLAAPGEPGRYEPITAGEYVLAKAEQAFAASRKAAS